VRKYLTENPKVAREIEQKILVATGLAEEIPAGEKPAEPAKGEPAEEKAEEKAEARA
jgi:hypothetical protein